MLVYAAISILFACDVGMSIYHDAIARYEENIQDIVASHPYHPGCILGNPLEFPSGIVDLQDAREKEALEQMVHSDLHLK
jgi:hypothetical protein